MFFDFDLSEEEIALIFAELAADHEAAEAGYRDMLAHPEAVVDAFDLFETPHKYELEHLVDEARER